MGKDKAALPFDGTPMIERVVAAARAATADVVVIANKAPERFAYLNAPIYPDAIPGMGPLSGLYTAFEATGAEQIFLLACDMPTISPEVAKLIYSKRYLPGDAIIPFVGGREQGLLALYRRSGIEKFIDRIKAASIQFDEFRRGLDRSFVAEEELRIVEPSLKSFENVNRPEELEALQEALRQ